MFSLHDAMPGSLSAVDDSLLVNAPALTTAQVTAASETHLFVQTVAKGIAEQGGLNIGDPSLYKSEKWYDALSQAVTEYAEWVEIVGDKSVTVNNSTHSGSINLSAIMGAVMTLYLGPAAAAEWSTLSELLGGAEDPAVSDFMNFWWSRVHKSSTDTGLSVGPNIETSDGQVQWAICYYSMTHVIDEWRSLFVSSTYEEFDVSAAGLTLQMDVEFYTRPQGGQSPQELVREYLGKDIANKIRNAPLPRPTRAYRLAAPRLGTDHASKILTAPRPSNSPGPSGPSGPSDNQHGDAAETATAMDPRLVDNALQLHTRYIHDVSVLSLHGDPMLGSHGIGRIDFAGSDLSQMRCGIFALGTPIPTVGEEYRITGTYDGTQLPFAYTLRCTQAGRPISYFGPVV